MKNKITIKAWAIIDKKNLELCELSHEYDDGILIYSYDIFKNKKSAEIERDKSPLTKIVRVEIKELK